MTIDELVKKIVIITGAVYAESRIRDAVEAYLSASNNGKPYVVRSVCTAGKSYNDCHIHHNDEHGCIGCGNYKQTDA